MGTYMLLIHGDQEAWDSMSPQEQDRIGAGHRLFREAAGEAVLEGRELASTTTATTLRSRGGARPEVTDGPFLETKEVVGGYYVITAEDLDAAIRLASLLPETAAEYASGVEIRPVVEPG